MIDLLGPASAPGAVTTRPGDGRTFGSSDTFFNDCSSPTVDDGTEFQAAWFNAMLANARALARGNGQTGGAVDIVTQSNSDDNLLLKAVQHLIQRGQTNAASDTGTANHVIVSLSPAMAEHKFGTVVRVSIAANSTGASDITIGTLSTKSITRLGGAALQPNDLLAGGIAELAYDGTQYQILRLGPHLAAPTLSSLLVGTTGFTIPSTAGTTMSWNTTIRSGLFTSTWNGTTLTVGAGEAGLWGFFFNFGFAPGLNAGASYLAANIYKNGVAAIATDSPGGPTSATAHNCAISGLVSLAVGDLVTAVGYQQSGSSLTTTNALFSAALVSA